VVSPKTSRSRNNRWSRHVSAVS